MFQYDSLIIHQRLTFYWTTLYLRSETRKANTETLAVEVVVRLSGDLVGSELFF